MDLLRPNLFRRYTKSYPEGLSWAKNGITTLEEIELNGLPHLVLIRGTNLNNPLLLYLHPNGIPSMIFAHLEYAQADAPTEKNFTVVHYDQRGYGKTYANGHCDHSKINIAQYVADAEQLVTVLLARFNKPKLFVLGESWGSVIGTHLVAKDPSRYWAYIGVGQVSNVSLYLHRVYESCTDLANAAQNKKALKALTNPGPPQSQMNDRQLFDSLMTVGKWADRLQAEDNCSLGADFLLKSLWRAPEYNLFDVIRTFIAFRSTQMKLIREQLTVDLPRQVPQMALPVYFVMGESDAWTDMARDYFESLETQNKKLIVLKNAGHMVRAEASEPFFQVMQQEVLPWAKD